MRSHAMLKILGIAVVALGIGILIASMFPSWFLVLILSLCIILIGLMMCR